MNGQFSRRTFFRYLNLFSMLAGAVLIGLFSSLLAAAKLASAEDRTAAVAMILLGIAALALGLLSHQWNRGAFLRLERHCVTGRYGFGKTIWCGYDEISFCQAGPGSLTLLLKNGVRHNLLYLLNAEEIRDELNRRRLSGDASAEDAAALRSRLQGLTRQRKQAVWCIVVFFILLFSDIFLTVALTGSREMSDFTARDWQIFGICAGCGAVFLGMAFVLAQKVGKLLLPAEQLREQIRKDVLIHAPLPAGNPVALYIDPGCQYRAVVMGLPMADDVCCIIQQITPQLSLITVEETPLLPSAANLDLDGWISVPR